MMTTQQAADLLGVKVQQVIHLIRDGRIKAEALGEGRRKIWMVDAESVKEYKRNRKQPGRPKGKKQ